MGAALQYRMLVQSGLPRAGSASALTATNVLVFAVVLALPVLAVPAIAGGAVNHRLIQATLIGVLVFIGLFVVGVAMLGFDRPLLATARLAQRVRNRLRRRSEPARGLPARLVAERDRILTILGHDWKRALAATVGRWAFDYATLLAALAAVGSNPRPSLVLLAFCAAQVLAQIPFTPGGLGFVEAGLTGMLALAGVSAQDALVATFAYRLFSYWLMMPVGLGALGLHRLALRRRAEATVGCGHRAALVHGDHLAGRLHRGPVGRLRMECPRRGGAPVRERPDPARGDAPDGAPDVRDDGLLGDR